MRRSTSSRRRTRDVIWGPRGDRRGRRASPRAGAATARLACERAHLAALRGSSAPGRHCATLRRLRPGDGPRARLFLPQRPTSSRASRTGTTSRGRLRPEPRSRRARRVAQGRWPDVVARRLPRRRRPLLATGRRPVLPSARRASTQLRWLGGIQNEACPSLPRTV